jgi:GxxExxY protein
VEEEKPSTLFTFAASVTVLEVKLIANLFPSRILCFLRFLLFQDETNNMHPQFVRADRLSGEVIGAAIEVHRIMGPGLLESIYERCLMRELELRGVPVLNQEEVVIDYKGTVFKEKLKFDLLADGCLLVELKAIRDILPIHKAQLLSYMKLLNVPLGLLFNFNEVKLVDGISRLVLPGANKPGTEGNEGNEA